MNKKIAGIIIVSLFIVAIAIGWYIQARSFDEGFNKGNGVGYQNGYAEGNTTGYNSGVNDGRKIGYDAGYIAGNSTGFSLGESIGSQAGDVAGYKRGNEAGYTSGYSTGYQSGDVAGFSRGKETGYQTGYQTGYSEGYDAGYINGTKDGAGTGYNIRDPSYGEMLNFIKSDNTNNHNYSLNYTCFNFCNDVIENSFNQGIKCGFVYMTFTDSTAHSVVCFKTTDKGLIFVEPQTDEIVPIQVYAVYPIGSPYEFYSMIDYYAVIW
jgi:hypothetical protein